MTTVEVMHSFLEDQPVNRDRNINGLDNHICIRFIRKKFKCLIIFFLTLCVLGETVIMTFDKISFDRFHEVIDRIFSNNYTQILK